MRFHKLDLNLLVALDALLEDLQVTRAAARLHVSQPAMSASLSRLREHFGDELVIQVGRRMELTELGKELRLPLRELIERAERLLSTKLFDPSTSTRTFTLACTDYVWTTLIEPALARIHKEAPGVAIEYAGTVRDFIDRRVELLIVAERSALPTHSSQVLFRDPMVCMAWEGNKQLGESLTQEDFFDARHVVAYASVPTLLDDWLLRNCNRRRKVAVRVPYYSLVPQAIVGTPFIGSLPVRMARSFAGKFPLRIIPPPFDFPSLVEMVQWHPYQDSDPGLAWLRGLLAEMSAQIDHASE